MGEEIDRGGGIGVRDLDDLEPVVGRAPSIARIGLTQRYRHLLRRGLDLLAALLCAGDPLLGKLAEQRDPRESKQRHRETVRSVQSDFHFTFTHETISLQATSFPVTLACVTKARGGGELPRFRVRSVLFELPSSPDATMSDDKGGCPFDLRLSIKIVSRTSIHTLVIS